MFVSVNAIQTNSLTSVGCSLWNMDICIHINTITTYATCTTLSHTQETQPYANTLIKEEHDLSVALKAI